MNLRPEEDEIIGAWIFDGTSMRGDAASDRIKHLLAHVLKKLGESKDFGGWEVLYRDPADGRLWERTFPQGHMQGGGPPKLATISHEEALRKYGPDVLAAIDE
jgi:immunity protein 27 of polymorphic toxin system